VAGPPAPEPRPFPSGLVLTAFLVLEVVLAFVGAAGIVKELASPVAERCTGPGDTTFASVSITAAVGAVPLGLLLLLALAAFRVRAEDEIPRPTAQAVAAAVATGVAVLATLGWFGTCGGVGPFGG
jgi:hypothetical protein